MDEADKDNVAFTFYHEFRRSTCIVFMLRNILATFQRTVHAILFIVKRQIALVYSEDITIFLELLR